MKVPFLVVTAFKATAAISGREQLFEPGDTFVCELGQNGEVVTIEVNHTLFPINRSTLDDCCISNTLRTV
jgi:hypothetical protein